MPLTATEWAYIAGIIDGEGSIILTRSCARSSQAYVYPQVKIANTDARLIEWLKHKVGVGSIGYTSRLHDGCKDVYHWGVASNQAYDLLLAVRPYLVVKAHQADVVISVWEENAAALQLAGRDGWGNYHPVPMWLRNWRNACFLYLKDLNRRGPGPMRFGHQVRALLQEHDQQLDDWRRLCPKPTS